MYVLRSSNTFCYVSTYVIQLFSRQIVLSSFWIYLTKLFWICKNKKIDKSFRGILKKSEQPRSYHLNLRHRVVWRDAVLQQIWCWWIPDSPLLYRKVFKKVHIKLFFTFSLIISVYFLMDTLKSVCWSWFGFISCDKYEHTHLRLWILSKLRALFIFLKLVVNSWTLF